MKKRQTGETTYSEEIPGDKGNWDFPARFDFTDGFIGITQRPGIATERVLLTPRQFDELVKFVKKQRGEGEG